MYNRNFRKDGVQKRYPKDGRFVASKTNSNFSADSKRSAENRFNKKRKPFGTQNQGRRSRFAGTSIDIRKFINKANPAEQVVAHVAQISFAEFEIHETLKKAIARRNFTLPTAIQEKSIPHALAGKDVIGLADTGTGKTGAFLVPMINKILSNSQEKVLIVVPTRELALQIQDELRAFTQGLHINSVVAVGGANIRPQISQLRSRHNFVIGTPGRLKDLIQRKNLILSGFANVVLDEADQMLDMGFIGDIKFLLSLMREKRQTLFFSATLSPEIEKLIKDFLKDPVTIALKTRDTSAQVDQDVIRIKPGEDKVEVLHNLLNQAAFQKVLIFARTKHGAEKLSRLLHQKGFRAESIHGDKSQNKRQRALKMFKDNHTEILVATDVAARGLDIPNVSHVINFDVPATYEDYIHRIGRTGRAGKTGTALTFI